MQQFQLKNLLVHKGNQPAFLPAVKSKTDD